MPVIRLENVGDLTYTQKEKLVKDFTKVVVDVTGKSADSVYVKIEEVSPENFGVGGELLSKK